MKTLAKSRLFRYRKILSNFQKFNKKQKKWIVNNTSDDFTKFICELCLNCDKIELDQKQKKTMGKYKKIIKKLMCPNSNLEKRKKLIQKAGFAPVSKFLCVELTCLGK